MLQPHAPIPVGLQSMSEQSLQQAFLAHETVSGNLHEADEWLSEQLQGHWSQASCPQVFLASLLALSLFAGHE